MCPRRQCRLAGNKCLIHAVHTHAHTSRASGPCGWDIWHPLHFIQMVCNDRQLLRKCQENAKIVCRYVSCLVRDGVLHSSGHALCFICTKTGKAFILRKLVGLNFSVLEGMYDDEQRIC